LTKAVDELPAAAALLLIAPLRILVLRIMLLLLARRLLLARLTVTALLRIALLLLAGATRIALRLLGLIGHGCLLLAPAKATTEGQ
jgi:hypothetical protein